jgi:hypothetical protein
VSLGGKKGSEKSLRTPQLRKAFDKCLRTRAPTLVPSENDRVFLGFVLFHCSLKVAAADQYGQAIERFYAGAQQDL